MVAHIKPFNGYVDSRVCGGAPDVSAGRGERKADAAPDAIGAARDYDDLARSVSGVSGAGNVRNRDLSGRQRLSKRRNKQSGSGAACGVGGVLQHLVAVIV